MSFKSLFLPDNKKFFLLFDKVAGNLQQMSRLFREAVSNDIEALDVHIDRLDEIEKSNDMLTHKLFIELGKNFITPFDREDIHYLASGLDDIIDDMLGIIKQMRSHKIPQGGGVVNEIVVLNERAITLLSAALQALRNTRALNGISHQCEETKSVLISAEEILDKAGHDLFKESHGELHIIRYMDHYEKLQQLMKRIGDAVHVIESIIIKYG